MQPTPSHPKHPKPCPRKTCPVRNGASCLAECCLFDILNNEFAALELGIYGLCNWLKHFDERLGDNLQHGIMVQFRGWDKLRQATKIYRSLCQSRVKENLSTTYPTP